MIKKITLLSFLLLSLDGHTRTTIEMDNKKFECEKTSNQLFHCENGNHKVLVVKNFMGYGAVEKKGNELPKVKWLTKVIEDNKILYEIPAYPGLSQANGGGTFGLFKKAESKSDHFVAASAVVTNLKEIKDSWATEFVQASQNYMAAQSLIKAQMKIQDYNGEQFSCQEGQTRNLTPEEKNYQQSYATTLKCNYYACTNQAGEKALAYIPAPGSFLGEASFFKLKGENSEFRYDGFKVIDGDVSQLVPLYDNPPLPKFEIAQNFQTQIDQKLFTPKKYQKNATTFNYLTNPMTDMSVQEQENLCDGDNEVRKLIKEKDLIAEKMKDDLATTNLSHYLMMTNGQMLSLLVDAEKGRDLGCRYDNMILSPEAAAHLDYLKKAKPLPATKYLSITEVQDLFKKAKNMSDIPFGYKYDGCYARAHVMARRFEEMGIPTEKAWIKGSLFVPDTDIQWNYHVAPVINVKNEKGEIKKYVIDPSLTNKAVTLDEWVDTMGKNVKGGVMKTAYPFPVNVAQFQRTAVAISSSDIYVPDNDELRSEEQNMAMAMQTMKEYSAVLSEGNK